MTPGMTPGMKGMTLVLPKLHIPLSILAGINLVCVSSPVSLALHEPLLLIVSTTCVVYDSVSCFRTNPKQAVGNRRGSASSEKFRIAFLWKMFASFDGLFANQKSPKCSNPIGNSFFCLLVRSQNQTLGAFLSGVRLLIA